MTLRDLTAALPALHGLTPTNVGFVCVEGGVVVLEIDSPALERLEAAVSEAQAGERCVEGELAQAEEEIHRLKEENRKLREIIGKGP